MIAYPNEISMIPISMILEGISLYWRGPYSGVSLARLPVGG